MPKKISFIIILLFTCHLVVGQEDTPDQRIERLSQKRLTYYWFGFFCPSFINTKDIYGFNIECAGCIVTGQINRRNRRTVRKINKVYGKNWFQTNKSKFY